MVIKNGQLVIYEVEDKYLKYLSKFDKNVSKNPIEDILEF